MNNSSKLSGVKDLRLEAFLDSNRDFEFKKVIDNDSSLIYKAKKKDGNSERYVAINLKNSQTIEIRIFRGTLNFNSFMKNIEFAHALFMYTKENKTDYLFDKLI